MATVEQSERDQFCDETPRRRDQHRRRRQFDGMAQPHRSHHQNDHRHHGEKDSVQERADDLGAVVAEGAVEISRALCDAGRHIGKRHAAHG